jgi:hypothetical protein
MEQFSLIPVKYYYLSLAKIGTFDSYRLSEMEYGGMLIFYGITPGYYLNLLWKGCGNCLPEIVALAKRNERSAFSIVNNILKEATDFRLQNRPHLGNKIYASFILKDHAKERRIMSLELLNLDPYWDLLSEKAREKVVKKSRRS